MNEERFAKALRLVDGMSRRAALRRLGSGGLAAAGMLQLRGTAEATTSAQQGTVTTGADPEAVARRVVDAINTGDVDALDALVAEDFVGHVPVPLPGQGKGREGVKENLVALRAAFPDAELRVEELVVAGETVVVRGVLRGTHEGAFLGIPPTGQRLTLSGVCIARVIDGRGVEYWSQFDTLAALEQTGLFSLEDATATDGEEAGEPTPGY